MNLLIQNNMIDDDQTMMLMSYLAKPEIFELRYNSPDDWFVVSMPPPNVQPQSHVSYIGDIPFIYLIPIGHHYVTGWVNSNYIRLCDNQFGSQLSFGL